MSSCHLCNQCEIEKGSDIRCRCLYSCPKHSKQISISSVVLDNKTDYYNKLDNIDGREELLKKFTACLDYRNTPPYQIKGVFLPRSNPSSVSVLWEQQVAQAQLHPFLPEPPLLSFQYEKGPEGALEENS